MIDKGPLVLEGSATEVAEMSALYSCKGNFVHLTLGAKSYMLLEALSRLLELKAVFALLSSAINSIVELSFCGLGSHVQLFCNFLEERRVPVVF